MSQSQNLKLLKHVGPHAPGTVIRPDGVDTAFHFRIESMEWTDEPLTCDVPIAPVQAGTVTNAEIELELARNRYQEAMASLKKANDLVAEKDDKLQKGEAKNKELIEQLADVKKANDGLKQKIDELTKQLAAAKK